MGFYDAENYEPPAPVALVTLQSQDGLKSSTDVLLLIDTGADVTLLPRWAIENLELEESNNQNYELIGFDGTVSRADSVRLTMIWQGKIFRGQFLILDQPHGILGRNILNSLVLMLNGLNKTVDSR